MNRTLLLTGAAALLLTACGDAKTADTVKTDGPAATAVTDASSAATEASMKKSSTSVPADFFDLSHWNITLPLDADNNGKVDIVSVKDIQTYSHPDFFYATTDGEMVFTAPNSATTTPNSSNTRSELRYMSRGSDTKIKTSEPKNNFALKANPDADAFAGIGGRMEATVRVDHVARRAGNPDRPAAFSSVVGQIHGIKENPQVGSFGYGNEPLKIYFKKFPDHDTGSVSWNYERNLAKEDPNRTDINYPVWGNTWTDQADPGSAGIPLGQDFSYVVNVVGNVMHLEFSTEGKPTKTFKIDMANNVDANGKPDTKDNPEGYTGDAMYFKAGMYNQCSTKDQPGIWYAACPGTGIWKTDKANGDYAQATFSRLVVTDAKPM